MPVLERRSQRPKEFAPRFLAQIQIARIVNVVADRAFGVGDAVCVRERLVRHGASVVDSSLC